MKPFVPKACQKIRKLANVLAKRSVKKSRNAKVVKVVKVVKKVKATKERVSVVGKFIGNTRGFGFVSSESNDKNSGKGADIFIPPHFTFGAINGDIVVCEVKPRDDLRDGKKERTGSEDSPLASGKIVEIISRESMVGAYFIDNGKGFVRPVDNRIPYVFTVPPKSVSRFGLADGHRVVFSVDKKMKPDEEICPCFITDVLGHINDPGMDVLTLVHQSGVPYEFSDEVASELFEVPDEISPHDFYGRRDLRDMLTFTIDGDDTKDIDDAISFDIVSDEVRHFRLGVHIADVSHYVTENSALDIAAFERGTSVYLADRVIPMLPHKLSSGICSLFPDVDRLTLSCVMGVDFNGNVLYREIFQSVIRSKKRWTYAQVQDLLDGVEDIPVWKDLFSEMDILREILRNKRMSRGALDFDLPETKIRVDDSGKPISIEPYPRTLSTGIIEEFMILCNETIASFVLENELPGVFRTHESPSPIKIAQLQGISKGVGFALPKNADKPMALQRLLAATADTPAAYVVANAVLHSLPQAHYSTDNPSHYGLASQGYSHFTSPIRRYADLQIHRIIKAWLAQAELSKFPPILPEICAQCSRTERIAEGLEREVTQLKKVQFMAEFEGKVFKAVISSITSWGVYVMLENTVEGLITINNLRRHNFEFNKEKNIYETKKRGKKGSRSAVDSLRPGSQVKARLVDVSEEERKLTFAICF